MQNHLNCEERHTMILVVERLAAMLSRRQWRQSSVVVLLLLCIWISSWNSSLHHNILPFEDRRLRASSSHQVISTTEITAMTQLEDQNRIACLRSVLSNLPIGYGRPKRKRRSEPTVFAHHYDAGDNSKWNADLRIERGIVQLESSDCTVWEVGAHTSASDSQSLSKIYPNCMFHAFEPIPTFFSALIRTTKRNPRIKAYNFGIGANESVFHVAPDSLNRQATYIGDSVNGTIEAHIKSFDYAIQQAGGRIPTLLHMNCEGCEWDMIPAAINTGFISQIPVIHIGTHNYGEVGLGARVWELCEIHNKLNRTHRMVKGIPFAWERWVLR